MIDSTAAISSMVKPSTAVNRSVMRLARMRVPFQVGDLVEPGISIGILRSAIERFCGLTICALLVFMAAALPVYAAVNPTDRLGGLELTQRPDVTVAMMPDVGMAAGILVGPDGRELWARVPHERRAMASVTKIMTALIVLENTELDDEVTVSSSAVRVGQSAAEIRAGEVYTVRELMPALLVKSGNDAAYALAEHVAGTSEAFVAMMNDRATSLGLSDTSFANPHGLDAQGHYSTAADLATLSRVAMAHPEFRRVASMQEAILTSGSRVRTLDASNLLIGSYAGATGVKTGWTGRAGYCVVGSAERDGLELFAVVLGTPNEAIRFTEAAALLDWGYEHYSTRQLANRGVIVGDVVVSDYLDVSVDAYVSRDVTATVFDVGDPIATEIRILPSMSAPVVAGQRLGTIVFRQGNRLIATAPLVAGADVVKPGFVERVGIAIRRLIGRL